MPGTCGPEVRAPKLRSQSGCRCSELFQVRLHFKSKAPWVRGPAARMSSSFTASFNFKVALRLRHADRRSSPPVRAPSPRNAAQNFFKCDCISRVRHPGCAGLRPACLQVSPRHLISKWHCAGDMRTGGPRTQAAPPRARTTAQNSCHSRLGARAIALCIENSTQIILIECSLKPFDLDATLFTHITT